jgi:acylphosphatase
MQRLNITVSGKVQGVGFRAFVYDKAQGLGLAGFVKNMPDGNVFIDVQGDEETLNKFLEYVHQGPIRSRVDKVEIKKINHLMNLKEFMVKY